MQHQPHPRTRAVAARATEEQGLHQVVHLRWVALHDSYCHIVAGAILVVLATSGFPREAGGEMPRWHEEIRSDHAAVHYLLPVVDHGR